MVVVPPGPDTSRFSVEVDVSPQPTRREVTDNRQVAPRAVMSFLMIFLSPIGFQRPATSPEAPNQSPSRATRLQDLCQAVFGHSQVVPRMGHSAIVAHAPNRT